MNNAIFSFERPKNESVKAYAPGSEERKLLNAELERQSAQVLDIPLIIGGKEIRTGKTGNIVMPHDHGHVLATYHMAGENEVQMAIEAALKARKYWESVSWVERTSIAQKAAELISKKYRYILNAATMLGQSKNAYQAEIDSACETIDFLRFNNYFATEIYNDQPLSEEGIINRTEYRPLEGFVLAITPFNFTAIASNLNMSPILMGNAVVWKPSTTSILSNYYLMQVFKEAGIPDGIINFIPGSGSVIGNVCLNHKEFAGLHFTGSTGTFNHIWRTVGSNLANYRSYPKMVGETGGKDFIFVHPSAHTKEVSTAIIRGAFEYQGQKCSAASRSYIPKSLWSQIWEEMKEMLAQIKVGDVKDFSNFMNAVIDENSFDSIMTYIQKTKDASDAEVIWGGTGDKSKGYFIQPTVILTSNPHFKTMEEEIFGPVMTIYLYEDDDFDKTLDICDQTSPYALTGAIFSSDREALNHACRKLRYAAGNIYFNDKPTGAVVGQQPFGGARASGTNDKAGSHLNLIRWTNPRTIKETLLPPTDFKYPFLREE
jgi:1-pyrroline-5-carboxylate dehydrogenase